MPPLRVPVPISLAPLLKVTVSPSGGVPREELTTAVKLTSCPNCEGEPEVATDVEVFAGSFFTTWWTVFEILPWSLPSPE
jgi:hypothetical protein